MANSMEQRPGGPWRGLTTETAPLNLDGGYLLKANDVVIRQNTLLEQRPGLRCYASLGVLSAATGGTTQVVPYYPVAINQNKVLIAGRTTENMTYTVVNPATGLHYLATEVVNANAVGGRDLSTARTNYWGYAVMTPSSGNVDLNQGGMIMGEPRIVNSIYTNSVSPARILEETKTVVDYDIVNAVDGLTYNVKASPLGVPSIANVQASLVSVAPADAFIWADTSQVSTVGYRAVMRQGVQIGAPSPVSYLVTPVLPAAGACSVSGTTCTVLCANNGLTVGDVIEVVSVLASYDVWKGYHTITFADATQFQFTLSGAGAPAGASVITRWKRPLKASITVARPKEQAWAGSDALGYKLTRAHFISDTTIELYRSKVTTMDTVIGATDPGDAMFKVATTKATGRDALTAGWTASASTLKLTYVDTKADGELGEYLYTNPDQEGIAFQNNMPPCARVHDEYRGYHFYGNVQESNVVYFRLDTPFTSSITIKLATDVLQTYVLVSGTDYTAAGSLTGSDSQKVEAQALSIVNTINAKSDWALKARYISAFNDAPGMIEIMALDYMSVGLDVTGPDFESNVEASDVEKRGNVWGIYNGVRRKANRIYWSKFQIPGAVARGVNYIDLRDTVEILGLRTTSDGLYVITDAGLWILSGDNGQWSLNSRDLSARCWSQGSIQTMRDQLIMLTDQGIQVFGDGSVVSTDVNSLILPTRANVKRLSLFADMSVDDEPWITSAIDPFNNEYLLVLPKDATTNMVLRYNLVTGAWTVMERNVTCVEFSTKEDINRLLFADQDINQMLVERQDTDVFEFCDEDFALNWAGIEGENLLDNGNWRYYGYITANPEMNAVVTTKDLIVVSRYLEGKLQYLEPITILSYKTIVRNAENMWVIILDKQLPTPTADLTLSFVRTFQPRIGLVTFAGGDATTSKRFTRVHTNLLGAVRELTLDIQTDDRRAAESMTIKTVNPLDGWGNNEWGASWGDETSAAQPTLDTYIPLGFNTGRLITVDVVNNGFNQDLKLQSVSIEHERISRRSK